MRPLSRPLSALFLAIGTACSSGQQTPAPAPLEIARPGDRHVALAFDRPGAQLFYVVQTGSTCDVRTKAVVSGPISADPPIGQSLSFCPTRLEVLSDGSVLLSGSQSSLWLDEHRVPIAAAERVATAASRENFVFEKDGVLVWRKSDRDHELPRNVRDLRIAKSGSTLFAVARNDGEQIVRFDESAPRALTPVFSAIDSFDLSPDGKEVVFSARGEKGFDVGLVSFEGGNINWISPDPADERNVSWAPRGNKVTYWIDTAGGLLVRTVHIPTSFQLPIDLPLTAASAIAWEPKAERFAMIVSSPDASSRIDIMKYGGESRATLVPPSRRSEIEVLAPIGADGIAIAPKPLRYGERYPVALWLRGDGIFRWNDARATLRDAGIGIIVTPRGAGELDDAFWRDVEEQGWIDREQVFVLAPTDIAMVATEGTLDDQKRGLTRTNDILVSEEGGSTLESLAAQWVAVRVKGQSESNGRK